MTDRDLIRELAAEILRDVLEGPEEDVREANREILEKTLKALEEDHR